jgi:Autographiviridae endonuclease VII
MLNSISSKLCSRCHQVKPLEAFIPLSKQQMARLPACSKMMGRTSECKECRNRAKRAARKSAAPGARKHEWLWLRYKMTLEAYQSLLEGQNGLCAICNKPETKINLKSGKVKLLAVDHDHTTGKIRGLLCQSCNLELGKYERKAHLYEPYQRYLAHYR